MNAEKVCELKCKYNMSGKCTCYGLCIAKDLFIEELENIKAEIRNKKDGYGKYPVCDNCIKIIDKHIAEMKGEQE